MSFLEDDMRRELKLLIRKAYSGGTPSQDIVNILNDVASQVDEIINPHPPNIEEGGKR
jgi:hypothetical protein